METQTQTQQPVETYESLASRIEYLLLRPEMSDDELVEQCRLAREYAVRAVVVRPADIDQAVRWLQGSGVTIASTAGYPDGISATATKLYEGRDLLRRGATEIDFVLNAGKIISRQFQHIEVELLQMSRSCQESGAKLKVALPTRFLAPDLKIIVMKIIRRVEGDMVAIDFTVPEADFIRPHLRERVELKGLGDISTLEAALEARTAGCARIATTTPTVILDAWKAQLAQAAAAQTAET